MPELPEVQTVLNGFAEAIQGKSINALECYYPGTVVLDPQIGADVWPAQMIGYQRRGKYMLVHLSGGHSLIIHLRMTGKLVFAASSDEALLHERARFYLAGNEVVHFIDPRTFGKIVLCRTDNLDKYMPRLGLEPLEKEFNAKSLQAALANKKAPIKTVLLDQRVIAGLGNIYVCEILYHAGIMPDVPAGKLLLPGIKLIVKHTISVLNQAIMMGGTSVSDFRRIDDKSGEFQNFLAVYQKERCPKGHEVMRVKMAGRGSFYCPVCQNKQS